MILLLLNPISSYVSPSNSGSYDLSRQYRHGMRGVTHRLCLRCATRDCVPANWISFTYDKYQSNKVPMLYKHSSMSSCACPESVGLGLILATSISSLLCRCTLISDRFHWRQSHSVLVVPRGKISPLGIHALQSKLSFLSPSSPAYNIDGFYSQVCWNLQLKIFLFHN